MIDEESNENVMILTQKWLILERICDLNVKKMLITTWNSLLAKAAMKKSHEFVLKVEERHDFCLILMTESRKLWKSPKSWFNPGIMNFLNEIWLQVMNSTEKVWKSQESQDFYLKVITIAMILIRTRWIFE